MPAIKLEQYADNIGMVRRVVTTIAGPRTYNLIHARVGNQTITRAATGSFSVSAAPAEDRGGWLATLRVDLPLGTGLRLKFPSGQDYDLRLRDLSGNILWTWSADKLFIQVEREVVISGAWSATVEVPRPPAVPEDPQTYILEAWLTTARGQPQFAAATIVEITGIGAARPRAGRTGR